MITAVIIEDEIGALNVLKSVLQEYVPQVKLVGEAETVSEAVDLINSKKPELIFLDIRLPDGDGFQVIDQCEDVDFEVIFTTAYGEYREKAFDNFALQYLTKPVDIDKLEEAVRQYERRSENSFTFQKYELLKKVLSNNLKKIAIPVHDGYALVDVNDIIRCEAQSNYTKIYLTNDRQYLTSKSLKHYDQMLSDLIFFRIHKSHLVNTNFLDEVKQDGTVLLKDGSKLSVSQRSKKAFLKYLENLT
jgi:two-component system LytT family response regulator